MGLFWTAEADGEMSALERGRVESPLLFAVRRALAHLELDPHDPRLATRVFATKGLGHVRATPTNSGDWYILWQFGPTLGAITILHVIELPV